MAAFRAFMSKLMPQVTIIKTTPWRITSIRCSTGIGTGGGPKINFVPQGNAITDEDYDQPEQKSSADTSNNMYSDEDEIAEVPVPTPTSADGSTYDDQSSSGAM